MPTTRAPGLNPLSCENPSVSRLTVSAPANVPAHPAHQEATPAPLPLGMWIANFLGVTLPFAGLVAAAALLWGWGFGWVELGLLLGMYVTTVLGVTVGFHQLFTHRSFQTGRVVQCILAALGSMAVQGPLLEW